MIEVTEYYRGVHTREALIVPGQYEADDPALFGLADYLVNMSKAVRIGGVVETLSGGETETTEPKPIPMTEAAQALIHEFALSDRVHEIEFSGERMGQPNVQAFIRQMQEESS